MSIPTSLPAWRPPRLQTERLILRGLELTDAPAIYQGASNPNVTRYTSFDYHRSQDDSLAFLNTWVRQNYEQRNLSGYALELKDSGKLAGTCGIHWKSEEYGILELGYALYEPYWGQGLAVEACRPLMALAFDYYPAAQRIEIPIYSQNQRSRRVAEKLGAHLDGILRSAVLCRGLRFDVCIYSILRGEWKFP